MLKRQMRKDEIREIRDQVDKYFEGEPPIKKKDRAEMVDDKIVIVDGEPRFLIEDGAVPLLKLVQKRDDIVIPKVTVDMGAIKFVTSGADVMRPGIVRIDEGIEEGGLVVVVDETHGKALALGRAMLDSSDMETMEKGKSVTIIHHVGDSIWEYY